MLALHRSGGRATRRRLPAGDDELGIHPRTELQHLEAVVLTQDTVLAAAAGQVAEPAGHAAG